MIRWSFLFQLFLFSETGKSLICMMSYDPTNPRVGLYNQDCEVSSTCPKEALFNWAHLIFHNPHCTVRQEIWFSFCGQRPDMTPLSCLNCWGKLVSLPWQPAMSFPFKPKVTAIIERFYDQQSTFHSTQEGNSYTESLEDQRFLICFWGFISALEKRRRDLDLTTATGIQR